MRKLFVSLFIVAAGLALSCTKVSQTPEVEHREMISPPNARLVDVQCDRPCAVFYDMDLGAVVMQYFDGSTYKVLPPQ